VHHDERFVLTVKEVSNCRPSPPHDRLTVDLSPQSVHLPSMAIPYPPPPANVPADLTAPSPRYKRHTWFALLALSVFAITYFAIAGWLAHTSYRLFRALWVVKTNEVWLAGCGILAAFVSLMMLRGVLRLGRKPITGMTQIFAKNEPALFEFIYRVADEVKAPKPAAVYISTEVNASLFYQVAFYNLFWPVKKNLHIGLGLINVVYLSEFKAVLAHEFGHFAQKTGVIGRYVYVAQRIAGEFIGARGRMDSIIMAISSGDLRLAWIGWILRLLVWSVRSVLETLFWGVVIAERALSREMEFQADAVAASAAGSIALTRGLYKLRAADSSRDSVIELAQTVGRDKNALPDLFTLQTAMIARMVDILDDREFAEPPALATDSAAIAQQRIFKRQLAQPPKMWATHPPNTDREQSVMQRFVDAPQDSTSPWVLFADAQQTRRNATIGIYKEPSKFEVLSQADALAALDHEYGDLFLAKRFRGAYLTRAMTLCAERVSELVGTAPTDLRASLQDLYPESLSASLASIRELRLEQTQLKALIDGAASASGGVVRFRGVDRKRKELPLLLEAVETELRAARVALSTQDAMRRAAHQAAGNAIGERWQPALHGTLCLLHYAEHSSANIRDAHGAFANVLQIVLADGKVSNSERKQLIDAGGELYFALDEVFARVEAVRLNEDLINALGADWKDALGEFKLNRPHEQNLQSWVTVVDGWVVQTVNTLQRLAGAARNELLHLEDTVRLRYLDGTTADTQAPTPPSVPAKYSTQVEGFERPRHSKLGWWDRFQIGDGWFAKVSRFAVAGSIVGGLYVVAQRSTQTEFWIYNGLERNVSVEIDGSRVANISPHSHVATSAHGGSVHLVARTQDGTEIESIDGDFDQEFGQYIYNIAGAGVLQYVEAGYGMSPGDPVTLSGDRWQRSHADYNFSQPPRSQNTTKVVTMLSSVDAEQEVDEDPRLLMSVQRNAVSAHDLAMSHARWTPLTNAHFQQWIEIAQQLDPTAVTKIMEQRRQELPRVAVADRPLSEFMLSRAEQDLATERTELCSAAAVAAAKNPQDDVKVYLALRCDTMTPLASWTDAYRRFPQSPWIAFGTAFGYADAAQWQPAYQAAKRAVELNDNLRRLNDLRFLRIAQAAEGRIFDENEAAKISHGGFYSAMLLRMNASQAHQYLWQGKIAEAVSADGGRATREMAGLSANAPEVFIDELVRRAPAETSSTLEVMALAKIKGRATEPFAHYLAAEKMWNAKDIERAVAFIDALAPGIDRFKAEQALGSMDLIVRGHLYAAAVIALGAQCPLEWRRMASLLLFEGERPNLDLFALAPVEPVESVPAKNKKRSR
jgi:Zn-dependent protease with chaperone function